MPYEFFIQCLETRGFQCWHTGGGCTAWMHRYGDLEILIGQDSKHDCQDASKGIVIEVIDADGDSIAFEVSTHHEALDIASEVQRYAQYIFNAEEVLNQVKQKAKEL